MKYVTKQANLAFTVVGVGGVTTVRFVRGEYETESREEIAAIESHKLFNKQFHREGQQEVRPGITKEHMEAIKARARAALAGEESPEPSESEDIELPSLEDIKTMKKVALIEWMDKLDIDYDPATNFQTLKKQLRDWIAERDE